MVGGLVLLVGLSSVPVAFAGPATRALSVRTTFVAPAAPTVPRSDLAPSTPQDLQVVAANGSVNATWRASFAPDGDPILYTLRWSNYPGGSPAGEVATGATSLMEPDLDNGLTYYFSVNASTPDGSSACSSVVAATPATVPYPPTILEVDTASSSEVGVAWSPPALSGGSPVTGYLLRYSANGSGTWSSLPTGLDLSVDLVGLSPMTHYRVDVLAENSLGTSFPSATLGATTFAGPASPSHLPPVSNSLPPIVHSSTMTTVGSLLGIALVAVLVGPLIWIILRWRGPRARSAPSSGPE